MLRNSWEEVLSEASGCRDENVQPMLLATVKRLLPLCTQVCLFVCVYALCLCVVCVVSASSGLIGKK